MTSKVVVLEDDPQIVSAFQKLFRNERIEAVFFERPDDVKEFLVHNGASLLIVDCLLPGISGIDFIVNLRKAYPPESLDVLLMSGVFTEGGFVRDALRSTKAVAFLKKPFSVNEVLPYVKKQPKVDDQFIPRKSLYQIFGKNDVTARQRKKTIEALEEVHGFDLPFLYSLLVETEASGHLNIVNDKGKVFGISFGRGAIVSADTPDEDTFIGKLLIDSGYISSQDLDLILPQKQPRFLGERLIKNYLISPHLFEEVLAKQTSLRLTRSISDEAVRLNFVEAEVEPTVQQITPDDFLVTLHDWSASKVTSDWLVAHFTPWGNAKLKRNLSAKVESKAKNLPLVSHHEGLYEALTAGSTINELVESKVFPESSLYKAIFFLVTSGVLVFQEEVESVESKDKDLFYRKTLSQLNTSDVTEAMTALSVMTRTSASKPQQVFQEFLRFIGSEPVGNDEALGQLYTQLVEQARQITQKAMSPEFSNSKSQTAQGNAEKKLLAAKLFEEARQALMKSQFREAQEKMKTVGDLDKRIAGFNIMKAWSRLGGIDNNPAKAEVIREVELELLQIEPEERLDALYSFVQGLLAKAKQDSVVAKKFFEKALAMDSSLLVARRELSLLQAQNKKQPDLFNADLRTLVGNLFRKK